MQQVCEGGSRGGSMYKGAAGEGACIRGQQGRGHERGKEISK